MAALASAAMLASCGGNATKKTAEKEAEDDANTVVLFDGTSLKGWRGYNKTEVPSRWVIEDGCLKFNGSGGGEAQAGDGGDLIFDQKFLHMNILNPYEIFNEARRLVKDFDGELPLLPAPNVVFQERMFYPGSELTNNPDNFAEVAYKNTYDTPVWWTARTTAAVNTNGNAL